MIAGSPHAGIALHSRLHASGLDLARTCAPAGVLAVSSAAAGASAERRSERPAAARRPHTRLLGIRPHAAY